jgi:NUMOD3 motif
MILCRLCDQPFRRIKSDHTVRKHGITLDEYKARFPDAPIIDPESAALTGAQHRGKMVTDTTRLKMSMAKRGENHPFHNKKRPEITQMLLERNPMKNPEHRAAHKVWANSEGNKERVRNQIDANTGLPIGALGGIAAALSGRAGPKCYLKGVYLSTKTGKSETFASSYELVRFTQLDTEPTVKTWTKRHSHRVPFTDLITNRKRYHLPDLEVVYHSGTIVIEEVKGRETEADTFKMNLAREYCRLKGFQYEVIRQDRLHLPDEQWNALLLALHQEGRVEFFKLSETSNSEDTKPHQ